MPMAEKEYSDSDFKVKQPEPNQKMGSGPDTPDICANTKNPYGPDSVGRKY